MDLSYLAVAMLAVNLLVFLGGCTLAVYRTHATPGRQTRPPWLASRRAAPHRGGK